MGLALMTSPDDTSHAGPLSGRRAGLPAPPPARHRRTRNARDPATCSTRPSNGSRLNRQPQKHSDRLAGPDDHQRLLRKLDPHAAQFRDRRQAARRRRGQHACRAVEREEGRDADRYGDDAQRHARRCHRHPPRLERRGGADRRARSTARCSTPATASTNTRPRRCSMRSRCATSCAEQGRPSSDGMMNGLRRDDLRRHPAQPRRALEHPVPAGARREGSRLRPAGADACRDRGDGGRAVPRLRGRARRRRRGDDAAAAERADGAASSSPPRANIATSTG